MIPANKAFRNQNGMALTSLVIMVLTGLTIGGGLAAEGWKLYQFHRPAMMWSQFWPKGKVKTLQPIFENYSSPMSNDELRTAVRESLHKVNSGEVFLVSMQPVYDFEAQLIIKRRDLLARYSKTANLLKVDKQIQNLLSYLLEQPQISESSVEEIRHFYSKMSDLGYPDRITALDELRMIEAELCKIRESCEYIDRKAFFFVADHPAILMDMVLDAANRGFVVREIRVAPDFVKDAIRLKAYIPDLIKRGSPINPRVADIRASPFAIREIIADLRNLEESEACRALVRRVGY